MNVKLIALAIAALAASTQRYSSRAYLDATGDYSSPYVYISSSTVSVTHLAHGECAVVLGTRLSGAGNYYFTRNGLHAVQPGQYKHEVVGMTTLGGPCRGGRIESYVSW